MLKKVEEILKKFNLIEENKAVIVGFSGGADSVCLLFALKMLGYNVHAVHVHHGIRGFEADNDALFAQSFCEKYDIPFSLEKLDIPAIAKQKNISLETAAREERYNILRHYAKKNNGIIAVAHNKNDQAETVLMHLLRGSGLNGLCGMQHKANNIIRPILDFSREDIEQFNKENNLDYVTDSTNDCLEYSRNKIRLDIIPHIDSILNTDSINSITKCAEILNEYNDYIKSNIEEYAKNLIKKEDKNVFLTITSLPHVIQSELIKKSIELLCGNIVDIEKIHIEDVYSLFEKESGKEIHLPHNIRVKRIYDKICFYKNDFSFFISEIKFEPLKDIQWKNFIIKSCDANEYKYEKNTTYIDIERLPLDTVIRTRKEGDFIYPLGSTGKCTIKKFFIDKKIPSNIRNEIPLLAKGNEIYAIIGYTVSEKVKVTPESKRIIKIFCDT